MKARYFLTTLVFIIGCSGGGSGGSTSAGSIPHNAYSVAAASELPTCAGDIVGRLYYIEAINSFEVCKTTGWVVINIKGDTGTSGGLTVSSRKIISSSSTNFSSATGTTEIFRGGELVTFSDGSYYINLNWYSSYLNGGEIDFDNINKNYFLPASYTALSIYMNTIIKASGNVRDIYVTLDKPTNTVKVWFDTNNSLTVNSGDELLISS